MSQGQPGPDVRDKEGRPLTIWIQDQVSAPPAVLRIIWTNFDSLSLSIIIGLKFRLIVKYLPKLWHTPQPQLLVVFSADWQHITLIVSNI